MDIELLEHVYHKVNSFLMRNPNDNMEIVWHGGEPTLLGSSYIDKAVEILNKVCEKTKKRISHTVQSNLTIINEDIIRSFKNLGIKGIGTSYEIHPNIRGIGKRIDSDKYNKKFLEGLELLKKNKITYGIIYCVTKRSLKYDPIDIFYHIANLLDGGGLQFNRIRVYGKDEQDLNVSDEEFAHFNGTVFKEWWKYKYTLPMVHHFSRLYHNVKNKRNDGFCTNTGRCGYLWCEITPNGDVTHCCESTITDQYFGNIKDNELEYFYQYPLREEIIKRNYSLPQGVCKDCRFWLVCNGGCPWIAYNLFKDFNRPEDCKARKIFFEKYFEPVTGLKIDFKPVDLNVI
jgi:uncharacterized protein